MVVTVTSALGNLVFTPARIAVLQSDRFIDRHGAGDVHHHAGEQRGTGWAKAQALDRQYAVDIPDQRADRGGGTFRRRIEQGIQRAPAKAPAGEGHEERYHECRDAVGGGNAQPDGAEADQHDNRTPHVGAEMQRVRLEGLARGFRRHPAKRPRPVVVDDNGSCDDRGGPPGHFDMAAAFDQAADGFPYDPGRYSEQQPGFDQGRDAFGLGMAVVMFLVRRLIAPSDGEPGDDGGAEIDETMEGFRQNAK